MENLEKLRLECQDLELKIWKILGAYLLNLASQYKIRFHIINMDRQNKTATATIFPCCGFNWNNHQITPMLIDSIEKTIINNLDFIDKIVWNNMESFYE